MTGCQLHLPLFITTPSDSAKSVPLQITGSQFVQKPAAGNGIEGFTQVQGFIKKAGEELLTTACSNGTRVLN